MLYNLENIFYICSKQIKELLMNDVAMWAVGLILGALLTVIGILVRFSFNQLKGSFDLLLIRIDKISATLEIHNDKLINILSKHEITSQWLDNHEKEIDELKFKQQKLENKLATHKHK